MENVLHARLHCAFDMYLSFMHGYVCLLLTRFSMYWYIVHAVNRNELRCRVSNISREGFEVTDEDGKPIWLNVCNQEYT